MKHPVQEKDGGMVVNVTVGVADGIDVEEIPTLIAAYVTEALNKKEAGQVVCENNTWDDTPHRNYWINVEVG